MVSTVASAQASSEPPVLVVTTYDSIVAKHGLGPAIFPLFEKKCGCKVQAIASGDGAQMLSKLQLDAERAGKSRAHVVLGLDQATWERARPYLEEWGGWEPRGYARVSKDFRIESGFLPFDYGVLSFIADQEQLKALKFEAPKKLADLLGPQWRRQVILEDPRTSTPGLSFVLYADAVGGRDFWARFRTQWLTLAPGWDAAYGLFLKKEAPLVWSYTTSQAYHEAHGDGSGRYRALVFEEGNPLQIEGAALIKGAFVGKDAEKQRKLARDFLEFLLSPEVQALIPEKNWMLPVMADAKLPDSFRKVPKALKLVRTPTDAKVIERSLTDWKRAIGRAR
jgi:thiamine transport system substrate-binding protein